MIDNRKKVVIYASCHGRMMYDYLTLSHDFNMEYKVIEPIHNYQLIKGNRSFLAENLDNLTTCDVFIYHPIKDCYGDNSPSLLLNYLKDGAITVRIPYIITDSFWPVFSTTLPDSTDEFSKGDLAFINNKDVIISLVHQGNSLEEILELYDSNLIDFKYKDRWEKNINSLGKKERNSDIKFIDYIKTNIKKEKLFNAPSHISPSLIRLIGDQILNLIGKEALMASDSEIMKSYNYPTLMYEKTAKKEFNFQFEIDKLSDTYYKNIIKHIVKEELSYE